MAGKAVNQDEYDADHERRKKAGQVGWAYANEQGKTALGWLLTRFNSKSFDGRDDIVAVAKCNCCKGTGHVALEAK